MRLTNSRHTCKCEKNVIVILGASGDLARRKLIPALFTLREQGLISSDSIIIGGGRSAIPDDVFRDRFAICDSFKSQLFYHHGIQGLKTFINNKGSFKKIIIFLALPPESYKYTIQELYAEGFRDEVNLIIEKPFGRDYKSAVELNKHIHKYFKEEQIFRSDHYLAKEAVQNILIFRFANSIFEPSWNQNFISSIQINAFETIGVEDRGSYFDNAGSIRDMIQNHLFQMLSLITMDPPVSLAPEDIKIQKLNILKSIEIEEFNKGQYRGYRNENNVSKTSRTETWTEMKLKINNHRWAGTPVYIRTGKSLHRKGTEIGLQLKKRPHALYNPPHGTAPNEIIFKVQPSEGIILQLTGKNPGMELQLGRTDMAFCYNSGFNSAIPEAYQKLLIDALNGDRTLFVSAEETEQSWKVLEKVLNNNELTYYNTGSIPASIFEDVWIDFERYISHCCVRSIGTLIS